MIASEKTLLASIDKTYDLYFQLMELIVEVRRHAESRLETARRKKLPTYEDLNPNTKFAENKAIALLASSQTVNDYLSSHKLNWARYPELIKLLYTRLLASDYYRRYMQNPTRTFSEDKQLVEEFYRNELEDCEELEAALEEQSILWSDDLGFADDGRADALESARLVDRREGAAQVQERRRSGLRQDAVREGFGELRPDAALYRTLHEQLGH